MAVPDPNWLLSSMAQSAAAVVAIVAGFMVSRIMALSGERAGVSGRLQETLTVLWQKLTQIGRIQKRLNDMDAEDVLREALPDMIGDRGRITEEEFFQRYDLNGLSREDMAPYFAAAAAQIQRAYEFFGVSCPLKDDSPHDMREHLRRFSVGLPEGDEDIFERVYRRLREEREREQQRQRVPAGWAMPAMSNLNISPALISPINSQIYSRWSGEKRDLQRECEVLEAQASELSARLKELVRPPGLTAGFLSLGYFTLTGIVIPLALMPSTVDLFTRGWRTSLKGVSLAVGPKELLLSLYLSGLLWVLGYLVAAARTLTRSMGDGDATTSDPKPKDGSKSEPA